MKINIVGIEAQAKKNFETFRKLRPMGEVKLIPDPKNKYDAFCIGVFFKKTLLGYIPGQKGNGISSAMYVGSEIQKYIIENKILSANVVNYGYIDGDTWNDDHRGHLQSVSIDLETPETDTGRCIGAKYQRVTSFISYFSPYGGGDGLIKWAFEQGTTFEKYQSSLNKLAESGTLMHGAIEGRLGGQETFVVNEVTYDVAKHLPTAWAAFCSKYELDPCYMEKRFFDNELRVTGQPDFVGYVNGILSVIDWKSSKKPSMKHEMQVSIYSKNAQWDGEVPQQALIVCFGAENKQGFSVKTVKLEKINEWYVAAKFLRAAMDACNLWINKYWEGE